MPARAMPCVGVSCGASHRFPSPPSRPASPVTDGHQKGTTRDRNCAVPPSQRPAPARAAARIPPLPGPGRRRDAGRAPRIQVRAVTAATAADGGRPAPLRPVTVAQLVPGPAGPVPDWQLRPPLTPAATSAYPLPPEAPLDPGLPRARAAAPVKAAHHADLWLGRVLAAVPDGSRLAAGQFETLNEALAWQLRTLNEALAWLSLARVRAEFRDKLEKWIRIHILHASWGGPGHPPAGVTSPGRERVCRLIGMSVTSHKRCLRWWTLAGFIAIVSRGWTPAIHPGLSEKASPATRKKTLARLREQGLDKPLSQAYVLCVPEWRSKKAFLRSRGGIPAVSGPLTLFSSSVSSPSSPARKNPGESPVPGSYPHAGGLIPEGKAVRDDGTRWPGLLGQVTAQTARRLILPFKTAGWTDADILWGLDHTPADIPHLGTADRVRTPAGVIWWRLTHWRRPDGTLLPSPSQRAAADARKTRAEQEKRRAEESARKQTATRSAPPGHGSLTSLARDLHAASEEKRRAEQEKRRAEESARKQTATRSAPPPPRTAPELPPQPSAAHRVMAAILARRAAPPAPPTESPAEPPAPSAISPVPGYLQAVAAGETATHSDPDTTAG
jgi:hypothetical protein